MTKIGIHSLVFSDQWSEETARNICATAAGIGYDLVEVLIFDPFGFDVSMTRNVMADTGLELRLGTALTPETDISSRNPEIAQAGHHAINRCLEIASELGAPSVSGITYAAFNNYSAPPDQNQIEQVVQAFDKLGQRARELGVRLGIEPANRYESYMIQTLDQAGKLISDCGQDNLFIHMDTYHMNIEEPDVRGAIERNASHLGYAHIVENNRGVPGTGTFDFKAFYQALRDVDYKGEFTIETFSPATLDANLASAVNLWTPAWTDPVRAAQSGFDFFKAHLGGR